MRAEANGPQLAGRQPSGAESYMSVRLTPTLMARRSVRESLMRPRVMGMAFPRRVDTLLSVAGDTLVTLLKAGMEEQPRRQSVGRSDGPTRAWEAFWSLRQTHIFDPNASPFPTVAEVSKDINPRLTASIDSTTFDVLVRLSNLTTFVWAIIRPDEASEILVPVDQGIDPDAYDARAKARASLVRAGEVDRDVVRRRNRLLLMAWKHFWVVVVPKEKRSSEHALHLWREFSTQIILRYQLSTIESREVDNNLPSCHKDFVRDSCSPTVVARLGQWDESQEWTEADEAEKEATAARWGELQKERLPVYSADPQSMLNRFPYDAFRKSIMEYIHTEILSDSDHSLLNSEHRGLLLPATESLDAEAGQNGAAYPSSPLARHAPGAGSLAIAGGETDSEAEANEDEEVDADGDVSMKDSDAIDADLFADVGAEMERESQALSQAQARAAAHEVPSRPAPREEDQSRLGLSTPSAVATGSAKRGRTSSAFKPQVLSGRGDSPFWAVREAEQGRQDAAGPSRLFQTKPGQAGKKEDGKAGKPKFSWQEKQEDAVQIEFDSQSQSQEHARPSRGPSRSAGPSVPARTGSRGSRARQEEEDDSEEEEEEEELEERDAYNLMPTESQLAGEDLGPSGDEPSEGEEGNGAGAKDEDELAGATSGEEYSESLLGDQDLMPETQALHGALEGESLRSESQDDGFEGVEPTQAVSKDRAARDIVTASHAPGLVAVAADLPEVQPDMGWGDDGGMELDNNDYPTSDPASEEEEELEERSEPEEEPRNRVAKCAPAPEPARVAKRAPAPEPARSQGKKRLRRADSEGSFDAPSDAQRELQEEIRQGNKRREKGKGKERPRSASGERHAWFIPSSPSASPELTLSGVLAAGLDESNAESNAESEDERSNRASAEAGPSSRTLTVRERARARADPYMVDENGGKLVDDPKLVADNWKRTGHGKSLHGARRGDRKPKKYIYVRQTGREKWTEKQALLLYRTVQKVPMEEPVPTKVVEMLHGEFGEKDHVLAMFNEQHMRAKMRTIVDGRLRNELPVVRRARFYAPTSTAEREEFDKEKKEFDKAQFARWESLPEEPPKKKKGRPRKRPRESDDEEDEENDEPEVDEPEEEEGQAGPSAPNRPKQILPASCVPAKRRVTDHTPPPSSSSPKKISQKQSSGKKAAAASQTGPKTRSRGPGGEDTDTSEPLASSSKARAAKNKAALSPKKGKALAEKAAPSPKKGKAPAKKAAAPSPKKGKASGKVARFQEATAGPSRSQASQGQGDREVLVPESSASKHGSSGQEAPAGAEGRKETDDEAEVDGLDAMGEVDDEEEHPDRVQETQDSEDEHGNSQRNQEEGEEELDE
ncbi:hypothetical protein IAT38_000883 [Cryptococcus sp. DSM 104549]